MWGLMCAAAQEAVEAVQSCNAELDDTYDQHDNLKQVRTRAQGLGLPVSSLKCASFLA